jgi:signal transduction histidine kinase
MVTLEEIRNPLSCILLSAEMLKNGNLSETEKNYIISIIYSACGHINHDVEEMCTFLDAIDNTYEYEV